MVVGSSGDEVGCVGSGCVGSGSVGVVDSAGDVLSDIAISVTPSGATSSTSIEMVNSGLPTPVDSRW